MASINSLSTEVLDNIFSCLAAHDSLPLYATVSQRWRAHFEQRTFRNIRLKSSNLEYFSQIATGARRRAICSLGYEVVLPIYSSNASAKFETLKQQKANDKIFSDAIHGLFRLLASWETESNQSSASRPRPIALELLPPASPTDGKTRIRDIPLGSYELMGPRNLHDERYTHSSLRIFNVEALPSVSRINDFVADVNDPRKVCAGHIAILASKLSNLEEIRWELCDDEKKFPQARQKRRREFSQALASMTCQPLLRRFELYYSHKSPNNEDFAIIAVESPSPSIDHLSSALHKFSQFNNLTHLGLAGPIVIDSSLFWPPSSKSPKPFWPNLQTVDIRFSQCTPNGNWYFKRHPNATADDDITKEDEEAQLEFDTYESETDSDSNLSESSVIYDDYHPVREARTVGNMPYRKYRFYPDTETLTPLFESMARSAAQMPSLRSFKLHSWSTHDTPDGPDYSLWDPYLSSGVEYSVTQCDGTQHNLTWTTGDWRPETVLLDLWEEVCPERKLNVEFVKDERL